MKNLILILVLFCAFSCSEKDNKCKNFSCENGICELDENNKASCKCSNGFIKKDEHICVNKCDNFSCENGTCIIKNSEAYCSCKSNYYNKDEHTCVEARNECDLLSCKNGFCELDENNKASCKCDSGFIKNDEHSCIKFKEYVRLACQKMIPCKTGGKEYLDVCTNEFNSFYYSKENSIYAYYTPVGNYVKDLMVCVNSKNSCDDYNNCYDKYLGLEKTDKSCEKNTCDGNILKQCVGDKVLKKDCSRLNKACLEYGNTAECTNARTCDSSNFTKYCNDAGSLVYCNNKGIEQEYYCPYFGQICKNAVCVDNDEVVECDGINTWCEEGNIKRCRNSKQITTECSLYGENFECMSLNNSIGGGLSKNTVACFHRD